MKKYLDIMTLLATLAVLVGFTLNNRDYVDTQIAKHSTAPHPDAAWRIDVNKLCSNQQAMAQFLAVQYGKDSPLIVCGTGK